MRRPKVLVRRADRSVTHQDQALRLATSRLFPPVPAGPWPRPGRGWLRRPRCWARAGPGARPNSAGTWTTARHSFRQLNPLAILKRGYAVATLLPQGTLIRDAALVAKGAAIRVRVACGRMDCEVEEVSSEQ